MNKQEFKENIGKLCMGANGPVMLTGYDFISEKPSFTQLNTLRNSCFFVFGTSKSEYNFISYEEALNYYEDRVNKTKKKLALNNMLLLKKESLSTNYKNELNHLGNKLFEVNNAIINLKRYINIPYLSEQKAFYEKELAKYEKAAKRLKKRLYFFFDRNDEVVQDIMNSFLVHNANFNEYFFVFDSNIKHEEHILNIYKKDVELFKANYEEYTKKIKDVM